MAKSNNTRRYPGYTDSNGKYHTNGGAACRPDHKATKRAEAIERQAAWDAMSPTEKLKELSYRPGESRKQVARIRAAMVT
jgi:hypothetical protein